MVAEDLRRVDALAAEDVDLVAQHRRREAATRRRNRRQSGPGVCRRVVALDGVDALGAAATDREDRAVGDDRGQVLAVGGDVGEVGRASCRERVFRTV